jgi:hypothetical protein
LWRNFGRSRKKAELSIKTLLLVSILMSEDAKLGSDNDKPCTAIWHTPAQRTKLKRGQKAIQQILHSIHGMGMGRNAGKKQHRPQRTK